VLRLIFSFVCDKYILLISGDVESNPGPVLHIQDNCLTLPRRTSLFERSFVPAVIQQWNTLSPILRNIQSIGANYKPELLRSMFHRLLSIIHARLRNDCSDLKRDLFLNHLSDHYICSHCIFLRLQTIFHCTMYSNERLQLFRDTRRLHPSNCNILLFGNSTLTYSENINIINAVLQELETSHCFFFKYTFHDLISHSFFSPTPLFFIRLM